MGSMAVHETKRDLRMKLDEEDKFFLFLVFIAVLLTVLISLYFAMD